MRTIKRFLTLLTVITVVAQNVQAQKTKTNLSLSLFNRHEWRGFINQASPTIEGSYTIKHNGFNVGVWSAYGFTADSFKEVDFWLGYKYKNISFTLFDYYDYTNPNAAKLGYLGANNTNHLVDARVDYTISKSFPLTITGSTLIFGNDRQYKTQDYSTYIELAYPVAAFGHKYKFFAGGTTHKGLYSDSATPAVVRAGIETSQKFKISDKLSIPATLKLITNPRKEQIVFIIAVKII